MRILSSLCAYFGQLSIVKRELSEEVYIPLSFTLLSPCHFSALHITNHSRFFHTNSKKKPANFTTACTISSFLFFIKIASDRKSHLCHYTPLYFPVRFLLNWAVHNKKNTRAAEASTPPAPTRPFTQSITCWPSDSNVHLRGKDCNLKSDTSCSSRESGWGLNRFLLSESRDSIRYWEAYFLYVYFFPRHIYPVVAFTFLLRGYFTRYLVWLYKKQEIPSANRLVLWSLMKFPLKCFQTWSL